MTKKPSLKNGFTYIEMSVVIGILVLLASVVIFSFSAFGSRQTLGSSALNVFSVLNEARSLAMSSKDFSNYGVHINQNSVILFENSLGNNNKQYDTGNVVNISTSVVGNEILFNKVTGETANNGTITISLASDPSQSQTITIYPTGTIEMN
jgi:prepilin-type N-terminal cleavage/methylation domain-containing protein